MSFRRSYVLILRCLILRSIFSRLPSLAASLGILSYCRRCNTPHSPTSLSKSTPTPKKHQKTILSGDPTTSSYVQLPTSIFDVDAVSN